MTSRTWHGLGEKFKENMWDTGKELNKVIIGFLRQLLGVNKKTTNIGVLAETGKYPIAIKIFDQIIRYWPRLKTVTTCCSKKPES